MPVPEKKRVETPKKVVKKSFYMANTFEDALYGSPSFVIEEESSEALGLKRLRIVFSPSNASGKWIWFCPEIDTIDFVFGGKGKPLFQTLQSFGYNSWLIDFFAKREGLKISNPYADPHYLSESLLKLKTRVEKEGKKTWFYHLDGGSLRFQRILDLDPGFWPEMMRACRDSSFLRIHKLHLCMDSSVDLMAYVTESMKQGHYESNCLCPFGYFVLDGLSRKGEPVGKRSSNYTSLKTKQFVLETLYFGDSRRQAYSVVFYDKQKEEMLRKGAISNAKTRVEVRFTTRAGEPVAHGFLENIIRSYYYYVACNKNTICWVSI